MGMKSKRKGNRVEREIVNLLKEAGIHAERVPLSGQVGGSFAGDTLIEGIYRAEVKARASGSGFTTIERWKGDNDILFLKRDRQSPLVVVDLSLFTVLLSGATLPGPPRIAPGIVQDVER